MKKELKSKEKEWKTLLKDSEKKVKEYEKKFNSVSKAKQTQNEEQLQFQVNELSKALEDESALKEKLVTAVRALARMMIPTTPIACEVPEVEGFSMYDAVTTAITSIDPTVKEERSVLAIVDAEDTVMADVDHNYVVISSINGFPVNDMVKDITDVVDTDIYNAYLSNLDEEE